MRGRKRSVLLWTTASLIAHLAHSEESNILTGATVTSNLLTSNSETVQNLIGGYFKSQIAAGYWLTDDSAWFKIELPQSQTVKAAQIISQCSNSRGSSKIGHSHICATDTDVGVPDLANDCVPFAFPSGGWFNDLELTGQFFWLYRDGGSFDTNHTYDIHEVALYQVPNQTEYAEVITDYTESDPLFGPQNLVSNLKNQCMRASFQPMLNSSKGLADYNSCFEVNVTEIPAGEPYVVGLKHPKQIAQHAINLVQDLLQGHIGMDSSYAHAEYTAAEWEVRIGDSPVWDENPICPGGPFLRSDYEDYYSDSSLARRMRSAHGFTVWCNMLGEYTFAVARHVPSRRVGVCNLAVLGTAYIRDEPLPDTVELSVGDTFELTVPHVYAEDTIGNTIAIDLRLSATSEFTDVTFANGAISTVITIYGEQLSPETSYTLELESFDSNGQVYSALKKDIITVVTVAPVAEVVEVDTSVGCNIQQSIMDEVSASLDPIEMVAFAGSTPVAYAVSSLSADIEEALALDLLENDTCGSLMISLADAESFITLDQDATTLTLAPESDTSADVYDKATLQVGFESFPELSMSVPIQATVETCLPTVKFDLAQLSMTYQLGQGPAQVSLPRVTQEPECGLVIDKFAANILAQNFDPEILATALTFDSDKKSLIIDTEDDKFADESVTVRVSMSELELDPAQVLSTSHMSIQISFVRSAESDSVDGIDFTESGEGIPQTLLFDMTKVSIEAITCSQADSTWALTLPPTQASGGEDVEITLLSQSEAGLFSYREDQQVAQISAGKRASVMKGDLCPSPSASLVFRLKVDGLGTSMQTLIVPVLPANVTKSVKKEPLAVTLKQIQANGLLTIGFNSAVLWDRMQFSEDEATSSSRLLQQVATVGYPISELVQLSVEDDGSGDETETGISSVSLISYSKTKLEIKIDFADPSSISTDIREPDYLRVEFLRPELVLQSQTLDQLPDEENIFTLPIVPQYSDEEYAALVKAAETTVKVGIGMQILEFLGLLSLNQTISSMWSFILTLQFLVVMDLWQISIDNLPRIVMKQVRIIVFGEFFDKLDFAGEVAQLVDLEDLQVVDDGVSEKVGGDRLGQDDGLLQNIGLTQILIAALFAVLLLVVVLAICLGKLCQPGGKCRKLLKSLQNKIFFNSLTQFSYVSALKYGLVVMGGVKTRDTEWIVSYILLVIMGFLPFLYMFILCRRELGSEETKTRFGALYTGLRAENKKSTAVYPAVFLTRRYVFIVLTVFLFDWPYMQVVGHLTLTTLSLGYMIGLDIYEDRGKLVVEAANEVLLYFAGVQLASNLGYGSDRQVKTILGHSYLVTIGVIFVINLIAIIRSICIRRREALLAKQYAAAVTAESAAKRVGQGDEPQQVEMIARKGRTDLKGKLDEIQEEDLEHSQSSRQSVESERGVGRANHDVTKAGGIDQSQCILIDLSKVDAFDIDSPEQDAVGEAKQVEPVVQDVLTKPVEDMSVGEVMQEFDELIDIAGGETPIAPHTLDDEIYGRGKVEDGLHVDRKDERLDAKDTDDLIQSMENDLWADAMSEQQSHLIDDRPFYEEVAIKRNMLVKYAVMMRVQDCLSEAAFFREENRMRKVEQLYAKDRTPDEKQQLLFDATVQEKARQKAARKRKRQDKQQGKGEPKVWSQISLNRDNKN